MSRQVPFTNGVIVSSKFLNDQQQGLTGATFGGALSAHSSDAAKISLNPAGHEVVAPIVLPAGAGGISDDYVVGYREGSAHSAAASGSSGPRNIWATTTTAAQTATPGTYGISVLPSADTPAETFRRKIGTAHWTGSALSQGRLTNGVQASAVQANMFTFKSMFDTVNDIPLTIQGGVSQQAGNSTVLSIGGTESGNYARKLTVGATGRIATYQSADTNEAFGYYVTTDTVARAAVSGRALSLGPGNASADVIVGRTPGVEGSGYMSATAVLTLTAPSVSFGSSVVSASFVPSGNTHLANKLYVDTASTADRSRANHTGTQLASTISNFDTAVRTSRLDQMAAPLAPVALNNQKVTGLAAATTSGEALRYEQVVGVYATSATLTSSLAALSSTYVGKTGDQSMSGPLTVTSATPGHSTVSNGSEINVYSNYGSGGTRVGANFLHFYGDGSDSAKGFARYSATEVEIVGDLIRQGDGTSSNSVIRKSQLDANATADRARANHTGTQLSSTISDIASFATLASVQTFSGVKTFTPETIFDAGMRIGVTSSAFSALAPQLWRMYNAGGGQPTMQLNSGGLFFGPGGASPYDASFMRTAAGVLQLGTATTLRSQVDASHAEDLVRKSQMDTASTADRARANHTGTQTASTISDFTSTTTSIAATLPGAAVTNAGTTVTLSSPVTVLTSTANVAVTLPAASSWGAKACYVKAGNLVPGQAVTVTPASGLIDGAASFALSEPYASVILVNDGTNWFIF